ncbi:putative acetyltransferase [compost metagenome]
MERAYVATKKMHFCRYYSNITWRHTYIRTRVKDIRIKLLSISSNMYNIGMKIKTELNMEVHLTMHIHIALAEKADLDEILRLQYLSYQSEAEMYHDYNIPPLKQTITDLEDEFEKQIILKVVADNRIVGSVRAYKDRDICKIGKLIVHPDYQNRGIGSKLMNEIELRFVHCNKFELFTGEKSLKNIYLYQKLGYQRTRELEVNPQLTMIYLEKQQMSRDNIDK